MRQDFEIFEDEQLGFCVHMILNSYESMVEFHQIYLMRKWARMA
jgi:hypothetical protein